MPDGMNRMVPPAVNLSVTSSPLTPGCFLAPIGRDSLNRLAVTPAGTCDTIGVP